MEFSLTMFSRPHEQRDKLKIGAGGGLAANPARTLLPCALPVLPRNDEKIRSRLCEADLADEAVKLRFRIVMANLVPSSLDKTQLETFDVGSITLSHAQTPPTHLDH